MSPRRSPLTDVSPEEAGCCSQKYRVPTGRSSAHIMSRGKRHRRQPLCSEGTCRGFLGTRGVGDGGLPEPSSGGGRRTDIRSLSGGGSGNGPHFLFSVVKARPLVCTESQDCGRLRPGAGQAATRTGRRTGSPASQGRSPRGAERRALCPGADLRAPAPRAAGRPGRGHGLRPLQPPAASTARPWEYQNVPGPDPHTPAYRPSALTHCPVVRAPGRIAEAMRRRGFFLTAQPEAGPPVPGAPCWRWRARAPRTGSSR